MVKEVYFFDFWKTLVYSDFKGINLKNYLNFSNKEYLIYQNFLFKTHLSYQDLYDKIQSEFNLNKEQVSQIKTLNQNVINNSKLYQDTIDSLKRLSDKHSIYLISDGFSVTEEIFNKLIPSNLFSQTFFSYKYGKIKSEGLIQIVLDEIGKSVQDIHFIGDSIKRDYSPCLNLGIKCTLIDRNRNKADEGIITTLNEI